MKKIKILCKKDHIDHNRILFKSGNIYSAIIDSVSFITKNAINYHEKGDSIFVFENGAKTIGYRYSLKQNGHYINYKIYFEDLKLSDRKRKLQNLK